MPKLSRIQWTTLLACSGALVAGTVACSALIDTSSVQCSSDSDCDKFAGHPYCQQSVCVASNLGPDGCFFGSAATTDQFANQCSTATCGTFDNCARLDLCSGSDTVAAVAPPVPDGGTSASVDANESLPPCVPAGKNIVVVAGSTEIQPFLSIMAPLLAQNSPPFQMAYQPSGSCKGVDNMFNPDPTKRVIKDLAGKQAVLFDVDGTSSACSFGSGATLDVAASDVFASSCNMAYSPSDTIGEYLGPIQPMVFVVPSGSTETAFTAEMGHQVFGRGDTDPASQPYTNPALYFVRNSSSGTQVMMSRAINVDPAKWWGKDRSSSGNVRDQMEAVTPATASQAIGILSTDFADPERDRLRILSFKASDQTCAYYPDLTEFTREKRNVRDGHYNIWGPEHFFANVSNGLPSTAAGAFVTRFSLARLDQTLLDAIIKSGLVPACAMSVQRTAEMGPLTDYSPSFQCGCYFEATVPGGTPPASCQVCAGPADCPTSKPACNNGFCELK
jgi:ABC-type phosphate transport system substrate-binding protein